MTQTLPDANPVFGGIWALIIRDHTYISHGNKPTFDFERYPVFFSFQGSHIDTIGGPAFLVESGFMKCSTLAVGKVKEVQFTVHVDHPNLRKGSRTHYRHFMLMFAFFERSINQVWEKR